MSDPTLDELTTPLTDDQVKQTIYTELALVGTDTTVWKPGAVIRTLIAAFCTMFAAFTAWAVNSFKAKFLLLSTDPAWTRSAAKYDYGTDYFPASFATGVVTLTNAGAGVYSWNPGDLSLAASLVVRGVSVVKYYHNSDPVSLAATSTLLDVPITADEIGADSNAVAGQVNALNPVITDIAVTNPSAIVGADDESVQALVTRAIAAASAASPNGPSDAYRAVLTSAKRSDGTQIANRIKVIPGNPVQVVAGTDSGTISSGDLSQLNLVMQTQVVPLGVTASIVAATPATINVVLTVNMYDGTETDVEVQAAVAAAIVAAAKVEPIGGDPPFDSFGDGNIYLDLFIAAAKSVSSDIFSVVMTSPTTDLVISGSTSIVIGTVTVNVVRFAQV